MRIPQSNPVVFMQRVELYLRNIFFHKNPARFLKFSACIYGGNYIRVLPLSVRILYRNPLLKLCKRENRHEQTVNFRENHSHFLKNVGSKVKGIFHKPAAQTAQ